MLTQDISESHKIASLSKDSLILFFMIVPHLDSHGKINGEPHFIKGRIVPLLKYFTIDNIKVSLREISKKTNMKWFKKDGLSYIHSLSFTKHQNLNPKKIGRDELPSYYGVNPELVSPEVEVEVEGEVEVKDEVKSLNVKSVTTKATTLRAGPKPNGTPKDYDKDVVDEIVGFCGDAKSRGYFISACRELGGGLLREALGELKMRLAEGQSILNRGAYITSLIEEWSKGKTLNGR